MPKSSSLNAWGDIVCPECRTNIVTPRDGSGKLMTVVEGLQDCPRCRKTFRVSASVAAKSNERTLRSSTISETLIESLIALRR